MYIGLILASIPGFLIGLAMPLLFIPGLVLTVLRGVLVWFTAHKRAVWGKWLTLAFVALSVVSSIQLSGFVSAGYFGSIFLFALVGPVVNVVALIFIFSPSASQWFRDTAASQSKPIP
jgi:hypothetical protein